MHIYPYYLIHTYLNPYFLYILPKKRRNCFSAYSYSREFTISSEPSLTVLFEQEGLENVRNVAFPAEKIRAGALGRLCCLQRDC